jgi:hypothetical protein
MATERCASRLYVPEGRFVRSGHAGGIVDSMAYGFAAAKQESKAVCVNDWFYRGQGPQQLASVLKAHRDLPVPGVLQVLVKRLCGE